MHAYLPHLLSDIANAHRPDLPAPEPAGTLEEEFEEIERWVEGYEPTHTFGYHCGLTSEQFPPPEQLTSDEMKVVSEAFRQMMFSWNFDAAIPDTVPPALCYQLLIGTLAEKTDIVNYGFMTFEFCQYYPPECVFKEHCNCMDSWNAAEVPLDLGDGSNKKKTEQNTRGILRPVKRCGSERPA